MRGNVLLVLLLLWAQDEARSIRISELRVPDHAAAGGEALFGCQFDLLGEQLYSVKWYKDGEEFYRYVPKNPPDATSMSFERPGVTVDLSRSSSDVVTLVNLKPESAGVYRCEVSGEAPAFALAAAHKYVQIYVLPKTGPQITGLRYQYEIGDLLSANCTTPGSKPEAMVKWLVNNKPVHREFLRGPWKRVVNDPPGAIETALGLRLTVVSLYYRKGQMNIKCQATIAPLYQREKIIILNKPEPQSDPEPEPIPDFDADLNPAQGLSEELPALPDLPSLNGEYSPQDDFDKQEAEIKDIEESLYRRSQELAGTLRVEEQSLVENITPIPQVPDGARTLETSLRAVAVAMLMQLVLL